MVRGFVLATFNLMAPWSPCGVDGLSIRVALQQGEGDHDRAMEERTELCALSPAIQERWRARRAAQAARLAAQAARQAELDAISEAQRAAPWMSHGPLGNRFQRMLPQDPAIILFVNPTPGNESMRERVWERLTQGKSPQEVRRVVETLAVASLVQRISFCGSLPEGRKKEEQCVDGIFPRDFHGPLYGFRNSNESVAELRDFFRYEVAIGDAFWQVQRNGRIKFSSGKVAFLMMKLREVLESVAAVNPAQAKMLLDLQPFEVHWDAKRKLQTNDYASIPENSEKNQERKKCTTGAANFLIGNQECMNACAAAAAPSA